MLRLLLFPDANQGGDSSASAGSTAKSADAGSSGPLGSAKTSSTDTGTDANANESLADAVAKQLKGDDASESSNEADAEQLGSKNEPDAAEEQATDTEKQDDSGNVEGDQEDAGEEQKGEDGEVEKGPVPYERFQEVTAKVKQHEQYIEQVKPIVDGYNAISSFCQENEISQQDFNQALELAALANKNPEEFVKRMSPLVEQAKLFTGDKLPPDLQTKVDDGSLELPLAQELARLRSKAKFGDASLKAQQQQMQQREYSQLQSQLAEGAKSWETAKRASDPDYKPKANENAPDGKWEMTKSTFLAMLNETNAQGSYVNPVKGPKDMVALMDKAYARINTFMQRNNPKKLTPKHLSSNTSSTNGKQTNKTIETAPTMAEAVKIAMNGR